ncbi:MAG: GNAT family N-acetyltransferase [Ferrovum myxofaciens]|uniref:GNAT family N-acetyltransferase n=2 Tax=Ferrovum myxofaciens TaxID=416213 RepID=UPI003EB88571|nr:MAG: GNAT family N-acetyltransferase [Ferrovum myxofaciens]
MTTEMFIAESDREIQECFPVFKVLRPHLSEETFLPQVRRQQAQGFQVLALKCDGVVKSAAGFRFTEFLAWGKVLYIDDLVTLPEEKKRGYAGQLLDWLITHAQSQKCDGLHLDTGYARHDAHRLYLRKGLQFNCHHLALQFGQVT